MRWTSIILLLLVGCHFCSAQDTKSITIIGRVVDTDNIPLINANILDTNTKNGTATNKTGFFHLTLPRQQTTIKVTYVGFYALDVKITTTDLNQLTNDTLWLNIILETKIEELSQVEISANKIQLAYDKPNIIIIDFAFHQDNLLLLLSENRQNKLRLVDDNSNTLFDLSIPNKPKNLLKDCFGNLHIQCKDNIYQINNDKSGFSLMNGITIEKFNDYLLPCVASTKDNLFFRNYGLHNKSIIYFLIEKESKQKKLVHKIMDQESQIAVDDYYMEVMLESGMARKVMGYNSIPQQYFARKVERKEWFYLTNLSNPIYNPLLHIKDSIFIFNHVTDSAYVFNQDGMFERSFPINYHYKSGWNNKIIINYSGDKVYAKHTRGASTYLLEINTDSGQILNEFKIDSHIFPEKIKIRAGFAYYIYNEIEHSSRPNVYKQELK